MARRNPFAPRGPGRRRRSAPGALAPLNPARAFHPPRPGSEGWGPPPRRIHRPGMHGKSMWPQRKLLSRHAFGLQAVPTEEG